MFKEYQNCLRVSLVEASMVSDTHSQLQVALKDRGVDKLVAEAREENKENDLRHLGPKSISFLLLHECSSSY
jgi:hypothetical protein